MSNPSDWYQRIGIVTMLVMILSGGYVYPESSEDAAWLQGIEYSNQGYYDEAITQFVKVIELNPQNAEAYNNLATAFGLKGNFEEAIIGYTKAIEIKPDFAVAYYGRATAYGASGNLDAALADYNKAIEINARYGFAYADRAKVFYIKKEYEKSLADVNKARELGVDVDSDVVEALQGISELPETN